MLIAKQDTHAIQDLDGVDVRRFIRAGDPLPPGLVPEDDSTFLERPGPAAAAASSIIPPAPDFASMSVEDLQAEADSRGLTVNGTGSGGRVVKDDLVKALTA